MGWTGGGDFAEEEGKAWWVRRHQAMVNNASDSDASGATLPTVGPGGRVTRYDPISIWEIDMGDRYGIWADDMGEDSIDMVILLSDMGYLVTLVATS